MKRASILLLTGSILSLPAIGRAQVAGSTVVAVAAVELREVARGWSAKRQEPGQTVFNDKAGDFPGIIKHDGAVPVGQLKLVDNKLVLPGATRDALKARPPFEYPAR